MGALTTREARLNARTCVCALRQRDSARAHRQCRQLARGRSSVRIGGTL